MTIIEGQIETLKKLKQALREQGITRFNSVGEIKTFLKNYEFEIKEVPGRIEGAVNAEIQRMQSDLLANQQSYDALKADVSNELKLELQKLEDEAKRVNEKRDKNFLNKIIYYPKFKETARKRSSLEGNLESILKTRTRIAEDKAIKAANELAFFVENRKTITPERCQQSYAELANMKSIVNDLYTLIAGAIGENSVVNSLQQLSDDHYLFNDFSVNFDPPIYNKNDGDRIYSIQIDHLLVCRSGVFIIETKNWSNQSVGNTDLRSPVAQIKRASYALFVLLNSDSDLNDIQLKGHHWGSTKIPIRNIVVMTNIKPKEEFKHVKVLSLKELNGYIQYFGPIFSDEEVTNICAHLRYRKN